MNKKGFTLMELIAAIVIMAFIMMMIFPAVSDLMNNNDTDMYKSYEKMMIEYAMVNPLRKTESRIMLQELEELKKVKDECKGYVDITVTDDIYSYKPYIKCGDKYRTCYSDTDCGLDSLLN